MIPTNQRRKQTKLTQRGESILYSLSKLDYLSRSQIQKLHNLGGERNSRRVLENMSEYVSRFRDGVGEHIYYLNKAGREHVGCTVVRQKINQVDHYLMRNDYYIKYRPKEWKNERKLTVPNVVSVITDAYFQYAQRIHLLEVDNTQKMQKNKEKIARYLRLKQTGAMQDRFKYFPKLIWVTRSENRKRQLLDWCDGLDVTVHLWNEIK